MEIWGKKIKIKKWGWGRISSCSELYTSLQLAEQEIKRALGIPQPKQQ